MQLEQQLKELLVQLNRKDTHLKAGIGGSGFGSTNDLDLVIVQSKFDFPSIRQFKISTEELTQKRVSITPIDYLMLNDKNLWSSKFATMVYKSVSWFLGEWEIPEPTISKAELKVIIKREGPFFYNLWLKKLANEEQKEAKALELFMQEVALLIE